MDPVENWQRAGFGLYVHWPFCLAKCPYCDFNSHVAERIDADQWAAAYAKELLRVATRLPDRRLRSVYFGGGTPSLMAPSLVAAILDEVRRLWRVENDWEVTLEANPTSVEAQNFRDYRHAGVNRLSLGLQALDDADLMRLGRMHTAKEGLAALEVAQTVFDRVSFDLIYARQNQRLEAWERELSFALSLGTGHLSLYQLTIEPGTVFGRRHAQGLLRGLPDEELSADMYEATVANCATAGLNAYEVSNYAKTAQEGRHNLIYWQGGDYAGIGPGGHGRYSVDHQRLATAGSLSPREWLHNASGDIGEQREVALSLRETFEEYVMMGLRLDDGLDRARLQYLCPEPDTFDVTAADLVEQGLLIVTENSVATTARGRLLLNGVTRELLGDRA